MNSHKQWAHLFDVIDYLSYSVHQFYVEMVLVGMVAIMQEGFMFLTIFVWGES